MRRLKQSKKPIETSRMSTTTGNPGALIEKSLYQEDVPSPYSTKWLIAYQVGMGRPVPKPRHRCYFSLRRSLNIFCRLLLKSGLQDVVEDPHVGEDISLFWKHLMLNIILNHSVSLLLASFACHVYSCLFMQDDAEIKTKQETSRMSTTTGNPGALIEKSLYQEDVPSPDSTKWLIAYQVGMGRPVPKPRHRCYFSLRRSLNIFCRLLLKSGLQDVVEDPHVGEDISLFWKHLMLNIILNHSVSLLLASFACHVYSCLFMQDDAEIQTKQETSRMSTTTGNPGALIEKSLYQEDVPSPDSTKWLIAYQVGMGRPVPKPRHRCYFSLRRSLNIFCRLLLKSGLQDVVEDPHVGEDISLFWKHLMLNISEHHYESFGIFASSIICMSCIFMSFHAGWCGD